MSKSRNDYHRKFYDGDDDFEYNRSATEERNKHRKEKRLTNALRSRDISSLYDMDDDW